MKTNLVIKTDVDLDQLIDELKKEDSRNLKRTHNFRKLMWILSPLYLLIFIVGIFFDQESNSSLGLLFSALGFLFFAFFFKNLAGVYRSVDYGAQTVEMLKKAAERYALWQIKTYYLLIPILLFCIAFGFSTESFVPLPDPNLRFAIAFIFLLMIMAVSFFIGYLIWTKRYKPLRDNALTLLEEIEK